VNNDTDIRAGADRGPGGERGRGPYRVCFVCTGNICRSPMAEWVLRARVADAGLSGAVAVDSAGTGDWHVGDGADPRTVQVLARHGYPSRHVARQFEPDDLRRRDLVVALDGGHLRTLRRWADLAAPLDRAAPGPQSPDSGVPRMAELRLLREFDPAAEPDRLDVPDPYYGSLTGFEECLAMVEGAVPGLLSHIGKALETRAG
jgi:low molecular weight protein-tyrosine phosphatase